MVILLLIVLSQSKIDLNPMIALTTDRSKSEVKLI